MNQRKKAFTLIELLVVIAVIGVLMSILIPALAKARYQARRITCMANMKGQLQAIIMYATENQGKYPRHNSHLPYYLTFPPGTDAGNPWEALKDTYIINGSTLICPVLAELGGMFGSTHFLTTDGIYGGWDTPTAKYKRISYNWYANHRPPNSSGDLKFDYGEKPYHILICGIVVKNLIMQTIEFMVVYNEKYTERTVIQLIGSNITGKLREGLVNVISFDGNFSFFPPSPQPSSE